MTRLTQQQLDTILNRADVSRTEAPKVRAAVRHVEDDMQRSVCDYWRVTHPDTWPKTFHVPNGMAAKNRKLAAIFAGLGVKPGVLDLLCIARRGSFNGFALELKSPSGHMSPAQSDWQTRFIAEGWYTGVAFSLDVAIAMIEDYHSLRVWTLRAPTDETHAETVDAANRVQREALRAGSR